MHIHEVTLVNKPLAPGQERQAFQVWLGDELLIASTSDPEFDVCRALQARDYTGKIRTRWDGQTAPSMVMPIAWGASRRTAETRRTGPSAVKWTPFTAFKLEAPLPAECGETRAGAADAAFFAAFFDGEFRD